MARSRYPGAGDLPRYMLDPLAVVARAAQAPYDVAELRVGRRTLLLKRTADVGHVLAVNHRNYEKTPRLTGARGRRIVGEGLFTAVNAESLAHRRPVQPLFARHALVEFERRIAACTDRVLDDWPLGTPIDLEPHTARLAASVVGDVIFGPEVPPPLAEGLAIRRGGHRRAFAAPVELPAWLPLAVIPSKRRALRGAEGAIRERIRQRRAAPAADLLSGLVTAGLDDDRVRAEALSLSIAGIKAVTEATASVLSTIARQPGVAARARGEIAAARGNGQASDDARTRLPYLEQVVMESMRIDPPTPIVVRVARGADRLPSGAEVRRGTKLIVSPFVMHRDPSLFPRPEEFRPERFTLEARRARTRWAYLPFGAGPRACVGRNLAMLEIVIATSRVLERFELEPGGEGRVVRARHAAATAPAAVA